MTCCYTVSSMKLEEDNKKTSFSKQRRQNTEKKPADEVGCAAQHATTDKFSPV